MNEYTLVVDWKPVQRHAAQARLTVMEELQAMRAAA